MNNLEKYQSLLKDGAVDVLLLTSQVSRMYAAQYDVAEGVAVIGRTESFYFTDSRYIEVAQDNLGAFTVQEVDREHPYFQRINAALETLGAKTLGIEEQYLTYGEFLTYEKKLNAKLVPSQQAISQFRHVKEEWELERMRKAQAPSSPSWSPAPIPASPTAFPAIASLPTATLSPWTSAASWTATAPT